MANYQLTHTGAEVDDAIEKALEITSEAITAANEMADYIVDQGTSGNWVYRKWASGIAECWATLTGAFNNTTSPISGIYSSATQFNFPSGLFIEAPKSVQATNRNWTVAWSSVRTVTATSFFIVDYSAYSGSQSRDNNVYAIGKWK